MPRGARLDAPGTLHHVMVRGIEGNKIVTDDIDRDFFVARMGMVAAATRTKIYAWALMTNHAHILLRSSDEGLASFMRKLLTGYASWYNRRHQRHGHLFQNRYKSIVCEEEPYFIKLVGYIHLNPLRAGVVRSLEELQRYRWSGHAVMMNRIQHDWQESSYVLGYFGEDDALAKKAYLEFVAEQIGLGSQPELTGGGLIRSAGGWSEVKSLRQRGEKRFSDERILGRGEFVREILDEVVEGVKKRLPTVSAEVEAEELLKMACEAAGVRIHTLQGGSRMRECSELRKKLAVECVRELGMTYARTAKLLGVSAAAVNQIVRRSGV